jgi:hypothetical protein
MHYTRSLSIWGDHVDKAIFLPFLPQNANIPIETQLLQALNLENDLASRLAPPQLKFECDHRPNVCAGVSEPYPQTRRNGLVR